MSEHPPNRIHYTQLPVDPPGKRGATEWNFYRGEVGRLLAEGHEGKYVLVKGAAIIGMWDTQEEAFRSGSPEVSGAGCVDHPGANLGTAAANTLIVLRMPQLTLPTRPDGLFVDVLVGLDAQVVSGRLAAGLPVPPAVQVRGLLDTGTDVTCVHASVVSQLGAALHAPTTTQTAGGSVRVNLFQLRVTICDARNPTGPLLMHPSLVVMELQQSLPNAEVLIGLDILLKCKLFLDGPAGVFTLEW